MKDFAAIDFETANNERSSVCSVGIVIVRNGEIVDSFYSLIQPEPNYYNYWCSQVHGLCHEDTDDAPVFRGTDADDLFPGNGWNQLCREIGICCVLVLKQDLLQVIQRHDDDPSRFYSP